MVVDVSALGRSVVRIAVLVSMSAAVSSTIALAQSATVGGTVVDSDGRPLEGVEVVLRDPGAPEPVERRTTDADGAFELAAREVRPGREIALFRDGFADVVLAVTPRHLVVSTIELTMQRAVTVDPDSAPASGQDERTPSRYRPISDERKRAIDLYNDAVEQYDDASGDAAEQEKAEAVRLMREAASIDPSFPEPHRLLARIALKQQNFAEAARYAEDLLRIDPNDTEAIRILYLGMIVTRNHFRIGDAARRLGAADPSAIPSIEEHARTFYGNGVYQMSQALYQALVEISEDPATAYLNLGICSAALGDPEVAREAFERFLDLAPPDHPDLEMAREQLAALE
jgi:Tfp pilus assembly protein PilF